MLTAETLNEMSQVNIAEIDPQTLANAEEISIDTELSQAEKIEQYLERTGNPYCFLSCSMPVRIRFVREDKTLNQALFDYFSRLG
ncbi:MAG: hypothetical protein LBS21_08945 [Clostridiales bacterium]|jgi:hypothetical protein|nr:hypothetical protein [Clostridiales bacterium]